MTEILIFLSKITILTIAILIIMAMASKKHNKKRYSEQIDYYKYNDEMLDNHKTLSTLINPPKIFKMIQKKINNQTKDKKKSIKKIKSLDDFTPPAKLWVLEFKGDMQASCVEVFRKQLDQIIPQSNSNDEIMVILESGGGYVPHYGLAASQLMRIKRAKIKLTISIDRIAASGGYLMACVADNILAADFAIIGSVGVYNMIPNINKLLTKNGIEIEEHTAGKYKRTLTTLGENTDEGREKFKKELNITHELFKNFITKHRKKVDIEKVATGEFWYATQAIELNLIDEITTSDEYIQQAAEKYDIFFSKANKKKSIFKKLASASTNIIANVMKNSKIPIS